VRYFNFGGGQKEAGYDGGFLPKEKGESTHQQKKKKTKSVPRLVVQSGNPRGEKGQESENLKKKKKGGGASKFKGNGDVK